jgi:hypothetical protein
MKRVTFSATTCIVPVERSHLPLQDSLNALRGQANGLLDGQLATYCILDELRDRSPVVPDNSELNRTIDHLDELLERALEQPRRPEPLYRWNEHGRH